jgi:alanine dehydrogenase
MLILTRSETEGLLELRDVIDAVERAFELDGRGLALEGRRFQVAVREGMFHVVSGGLMSQDERALLGLKANGHFPETDGTRRVTGAMLLMDADGGQPLALLDSRVLTALRTAAVTAVAARRLARADARSALIIGAGRQAPGQIDALAAVLPLESVAVYAPNRSHAETVADRARARGLAAQVGPDLTSAASTSDVIVSVTTASEPVLFDSDVSPGCFVAALGADAPGKQELDVRLLANSRVVVDRLDQAANAGELRSALAAGAMTEADVHAELGEVVAGVKPGRTRQDERFVFDSTGTALQDVAAASLLVERARERGRGVEIELAS